MYMGIYKNTCGIIYILYNIKYTLYLLYILHIFCLTYLKIIAFQQVQILFYSFDFLNFRVIILIELELTFHVIHSFTVYKSVIFNIVMYVQPSPRLILGHFHHLIIKKLHSL